MGRKFKIIIPARNEEKNIGRVLIPCKIALIQGVKQGLFSKESKILVVDDASKDRTALVAQSLLRNFGEVITYLPKKGKLKKKGKAGAMFTGFKEAQGDWVAFIDADLLGLKAFHILNLFKEALKTKNMVVAKFTNGRKNTDLSHKINPNISGQRIASRKQWDTIFRKIKNPRFINYGIEFIITSLAKEIGIRITYLNWEGVSQVMKEEKNGVAKGFSQRIVMYFQLFLALIRNLFRRTKNTLDF